MNKSCVRVLCNARVPGGTLHEVTPSHHSFIFPQFTSFSDSHDQYYGENQDDGFRKRQSGYRNSEVTTSSFALTTKQLFLGRS